MGVWQAPPAQNESFFADLPPGATAPPLPGGSDDLYASATQALAGQAIEVSYTPPPETGGGIFVLSGVGPSVTLYAVPGENTTVSLVMTPGQHTLVVAPADTLNASCAPSSLAVLGLVPALVGVQVVPGCTWLVRWSVLGGRDDACPASVYALYDLGPPRLVGAGACTPGGCTGAYGNYTGTVAIDGYTPYSLNLLAATKQLGVGQRTPWAALANLYSPATGALVLEAVITRQSLGLVRVNPPGSLLVSAHYVQALIPGRTALYLGGQALAFNVTAVGLPPLWLELMAYRDVVQTAAEGLANATFLPPTFAGNTSATLLVYAWYPGQYRVQLTPKDNVRLVLNRQITVRTLAYGWLLTVKPYASAYAGAVVNASFQGAKGSLAAAIQPPDPPLSLYVCCNLVRHSPYT